jgi:hypothetical protein
VPLSAWHRKERPCASCCACRVSLPGFLVSRWPQRSLTLMTCCKSNQRRLHGDYHDARCHLHHRLAPELQAVARRSHESEVDPPSLLLPLQWLQLATAHR